MSPGGHCPQAEAPELVASCLRAWIQHTADSAEPLLQVIRLYSETRRTMSMWQECADLTDEACLSGCINEQRPHDGPDHPRLALRWPLPRSWHVVHATPRHVPSCWLQVGEQIADSDGVLLRRVDDSPTNPLEWIIYVVYRATTSVRRATSAVFG